MFNPNASPNQGNNSDSDDDQNDDDDDVDDLGANHRANLTEQQAKIEMLHLRHQIQTMPAATLV